MDWGQLLTVLGINIKDRLWLSQQKEAGLNLQLMLIALLFEGKYILKILLNLIIIKENQ